MSVSDLTPAATDRLTRGSLRDSRTPGLKIEAKASGRKVWLFRRRGARSDEIVNASLGVFSGPSARGCAKMGHGPGCGDRMGREPAPLERTENARSATTVQIAHDLYIAAVIRSERRTVKPRTIADKQSIYNRDIGPRLGNTNLYRPTENECWNAVYDKANASKGRADKMAGELACFLKWCCGREGRMVGIERMEHPAPHTHRNLVLNRPQGEHAFPQ
ncbi:MAG: hypothetical protein P0Y64_00725 [Candidatus Sphingomonas colombiensis]|nr:hypothetical protein [Sphingomonas sp.]WEK43406.1 MAG: hypothetical protein P0Y64_00725 [Sphingomonas sp.]